MKQIHLLLGIALFFTAIGFRIGQKHSASSISALKTSSTVEPSGALQKKNDNSCPQNHHSKDHTSHYFNNCQNRNSYS